MENQHPLINHLPFDQSTINASKSTKTLSTTGKILIGLTGGVAVSLSIVCASFVSPAFRKVCLPYIPATEQQVRNVFQILSEQNNHKCNTLIDLGSGDGRIVLEASARKYNACGVELNPWLVLYSKLSAWMIGSKGARFVRADLWTHSVHRYDAVVVFGVEQMMAQLEEKLLTECRSDCKVVACRFPLPNLTPERTLGHGVDTVWLYAIPTQK